MGGRRMRAGRCRWQRRSCAIGWVGVSRRVRILPGLFFYLFLVFGSVWDSACSFHFFKLSLLCADTKTRSGGPHLPLMWSKYLFQQAPVRFGVGS
jgi:hypothetical protein